MERVSVIVKGDALLITPSQPKAKATFIDLLDMLERGGWWGSKKYTSEANFPPGGPHILPKERIEIMRKSRFIDLSK